MMRNCMTETELHDVTIQINSCSLHIFSNIFVLTVFLFRRSEISVIFSGAQLKWHKTNKAEVPERSTQSALSFFFWASLSETPSVTYAKVSRQRVSITATLSINLERRRCVVCFLPAATGVVLADQKEMWGKHGRFVWMTCHTFSFLRANRKIRSRALFSPQFEDRFKSGDVTSNHMTHGVVRSVYVWLRLNYCTYLDVLIFTKGFSLSRQHQRPSSRLQEVSLEEKSRWNLTRCEWEELTSCQKHFQFAQRFTLSQLSAGTIYWNVWKENDVSAFALVN